MDNKIVLTTNQESEQNNTKDMEKKENEEKRKIELQKKLDEYDRIYNQVKWLH